MPSARLGDGEAVTALAQRAAVMPPWPGTAGAASMIASVALGATLGLGVQPLVALGGLALIATCVAAARRLEPLILVTLLAFFLPSSTLATGEAWALTLRWVPLGAVLMALVVRVVPGRLLRRVRARIPVSLIAFTGFAVMTAAWSVAPRLTAGRAATFVAMIAILVLVYSIEGAPQQVANALCLVGAVLAVGGLAAAWLGPVPSSRYAGLFVNPNTLGIATALLFPIALERSLNSNVPWVRVTNGLVAALLVGQVAAAASRGGLLAATAAYLYLGWSHFQNGKRGKRLAVLLLPAVLAVMASLKVADPNRLSIINSRESLWGLFPQVFGEHPIVGHGFGATQLVLQPYGSITGYLSPTGVEFHNSYFNVLSDMGSVGGTLFALVLLRAARRRRRAPAMAAVVLAGLVSALFESWMLSVGSGFSFLFWFALLGVAGGPGEQCDQAPAPTVPP